MAEITPTKREGAAHTRIITWVLANNDFGAAVEISDHQDKTVHVYGTFSAATVTLYGSNNPADVGVNPSGGTWVVLKDDGANNIAYTSNDGDAIVQNYRFITCRATGGGATSVTVNLNAVRRNV